MGTDGGEMGGEHPSSSPASSSPRQGAWCLQSEPCPCWALWQGKARGSYPAVKTHFSLCFPVRQESNRADFLWLTDESFTPLVQDKRLQRGILWMQSPGMSLWYWNLNLDITQPLLPPSNPFPKPTALQPAFQALLALSPQTASCDALQK